MQVVLFAGAAPTDLMVREVLSGVVEVTWTAPTAPPQAGYRVTVNSTDIATAISSPFVLFPLAPGEHSIEVQSLSQHYPGDMVGPVTATVTG